MNFYPLESRPTDTEGKDKLLSDCIARSKRLRVAGIVNNQEYEDSIDFSQSEDESLPYELDRNILNPYNETKTYSKQTSLRVAELNIILNYKLSGKFYNGALDQPTIKELKVYLD